MSQSATDHFGGECGYVRSVIGGMWKQSIFVTLHAVIIFRNSDVENTFFFHIYHLHSDP